MFIGGVIMAAREDGPLTVYRHYYSYCASCCFYYYEPDDGICLRSSRRSSMKSTSWFANRLAVCALSVLYARKYGT